MANSERDKLVRLLKKNGWTLFRQKGGHCQFIHPDRPDKITVPFKVKKNIELSIMRQIKEGKGT